MPDNFNLEDYKVIIQNFKQIGNTLYWADKPIASKGDSDEVITGEPYFVNGPVIRVEDGGTGATELSGILKGNGLDPFTEAVLGEDYITNDSEGVLTNKTIDTRYNVVSNIGYASITPQIINDSIMNSTDSLETIVNNRRIVGKLVTDTAVKQYVEFQMQSKAFGQIIKEPVVAASTGPVSVNSMTARASLDGVVLSVGDRILLKDQANSTENGIYTITTNIPRRSTDANSGPLLAKASVFVLGGIENRGTTWFCENTNIEAWSTSIIWKVISKYPIYEAGFGIDINYNDSDNLISIDRSLVLHKDMTDPVLMQYGGTGTSEIEPNNIVAVYSDAETGNTYLGALKATKGNTVLLSTESGMPEWSNLKYPKNINDKTLLWVDSGEIQGIAANVGLLYFDDDLVLRNLNELPSTITIGGKQIYSESNQRIPVEDGGTGLSSISTNSILYGIGDNQYGEAILTPFGRRILSMENKETLAIELGLGLGANLNIGTTENTIAAGDHEHANYVTRDGNQFFNNPVIGVDPIIASHLATKGYVDTLASGQDWQDPVLAIIRLLPASLRSGDRYLIADDTTYAGLTSHKGEILSVIDNDGTISYIPPERSWVVKDLSTGNGYIYNGEKWLLYSTNDPHNALSSLQGGAHNEYYHLSKADFDALTSGEINNGHYHMHNDNLGLQGGNGTEYYHLSASEYEQIADASFKYHNKLFNLQGGNSYSNQYYHLDFDQYRQLTGTVATNIHTHDHANLENINGSSESYHLSKDAYNALTGNGPDGVKSINIHKHEHNNLADIQGGNADERYHLDREYYDFVQNLKRTIKNNHNEFGAIQGGKAGATNESSEYYHLSQEQWYSLTQGNDTGGLHTHNEYIKVDGSVAFERSPSCPTPENSSDIANKAYVDQRADLGLIWSKPVKSRRYNTPPRGTSADGDRYIIAINSRDAWLGLDNKIAEWNAGSWSITDIGAVDAGLAVYVIDEKAQVVWNGTEWVIFAVEQDHKNLANLLGGENGTYYHLSAQQYNKLVSGLNCDTHYHADVFEQARGVLSATKGGTGLSSVPKSSILYTTDDNTFSTSIISDFSRRILSSNTAAGFRSSLGCGDMATQDTNNVRIENGTIENLKSPLSLKDGGTGLSEIPRNSMIYVNNSGEFDIIPIQREGLEILNKDKNDAAAYFGIGEYKNIATTMPGGRSKLFYLVAFGQ